MRLFLTSVLLAGLFLPCAAAAAPANGTAPAQTAVVRTAPPQVTGRAPDQTMPEIAERKLDNGIPVYIAVRKKVPLAHVILSFPGAGSKNDPAGKYGLAEFAVSCLDEGAGERDSLALAEAVDLLGASIGADAGWDNAGVTASCMSERLPETLDIFADVVMRPTFPQKELDRLKKEALDGFVNARISPGSLASVAFNRFVFGEDSRYGTLRVGTPQQVASFTRDDVLGYYSSNFRPEKAFICVGGDVDPDAVVKILNKRLGKWSPCSCGDGEDGSAKAAQPVPAPKYEERFIPADMPGRVPMADRIFIVDRPGAQQAVIRVGCLGVTVKDPDRIAIQAMNTLLGGSFASRLNDNLRERNGYTYGASSGFDFRLDRGAFAASTNVQTDKTIPAVREILKEIDRMHQPASEAELQRTLNYMAYTFPASFESSGYVTSLMTRLIAYDYPKDYVDTYVSNVLKLTPKEIKKAADRTLDVNQMKVIIVGDAKALEPQLKDAGWRAQVLTVDEVMGPKLTAK